MDTHVWLVQDKHDRIRAVGAGSRTSPYASHGHDLDKRRDKGGTVRLSADTFSTPADAHLAAAMVVAALSRSGDDRVELVGSDDTAPTAGFVRGLPTRRKALHYHDLHHALIVRVDLDDLEVDGRLVSGLVRPKQAADVVRTSWPLNRVVADDLPVRRLVAVTAAGVDPPRVVGIWKVRTADEWVDHGNGNWSIGVKKRRKGDRGGHVGRRFDWDGYQAGPFGYSHDLRVLAGLVATDDDSD